MKRRAAMPTILMPFVPQHGIEAEVTCTQLILDACATQRHATIYLRSVAQSNSATVAPALADIMATHAMLGEIITTVRGRVS